MTYRVVAFAPNRWHGGTWMNRQQLLSRLAHHVPVLYSNGLWLPWQRREAGWRCGKALGRFEPADGVWLDHAPRLLMRWPRISAWDRLALTVQGLRLRRFSASLGAGPLIGYVFNPSFAEDVDALAPEVCVYHAYDLFELTPSWNEELARRQRWLLQRADLVLASSRVIAEALSREGAREVAVLPNAADVAAFSSVDPHDSDTPPDVAAIPHPRIGYVGNLNQKVDFPLVSTLAQTHYDWHFVFVGAFGKLDHTTAQAVERCRTLSNVHFLGSKDRSLVPSYMAAMDVNALFYRMDHDVWTEGIYPLKLHEYLAVGRAVVGADIPSVREFSEVVAVAHDMKEWEMRLAEAIAGDAVATTETRRAVARQNDWESRVAILRQHLDRIVDRTPESASSLGAMSSSGAVRRGPAERGQ